MGLCTGVVVFVYPDFIKCHWIYEDTAKHEIFADLRFSSFCYM